MDMLLTRRRFIQTAIGGVGASLFPAMAGSKTEDPVRIGYLPITDAAPLLIAHANGFLTEEGLAVEPPRKIRSWSALSESFLSHKCNVTHMLMPIAVWMRFNNRVPLKVLAWDHTNGSAVTVRGDSEIRSFSDLGGKQIAVPYWYSMHNIILQMALRKVELTPVIQSQREPLNPSQVNLFILPPPEMPAALAGRKIAGYIVAEPYNAVAEIKMAAKILRFTGDMWKNHPCCVIVMHEETVNEKQAYTQKIVNAIVRAQLWIMQNRKRAAWILSREGKNYLPVSYEVLLRVFNGYSDSTYGKGATPRAIRNPDWNVSRIDFQPYPYPSATRFIVSEMKQTKMEGNTSFLNGIDVDDAARVLVDDRFVKKAIQAVGGMNTFAMVDLEKPWEREEVLDI